MHLVNESSSAVISMLDTCAPVVTLSRSPYYHHHHTAASPTHSPFFFDLFFYLYFTLSLSWYLLFLAVLPSFHHLPSPQHPQHIPVPLIRYIKHMDSYLLCFTYIYLSPLRPTSFHLSFHLYSSLFISWLSMTPFHSLDYIQPLQTQ